MPAPSYGQEVTGALRGHVVTAEAAPLSTVRVTIHGPSLQGERETVTGARGEFRFVALPVGTYSVRLARFGFRATVVEHVLIHVGKTTGLPPTIMERQTVELEDLVVRADALSIDPTTTAISMHLDSYMLEVLPIDRDYQSAVVILPHANESFYGDAANIGGATGLENMYFVDGVNVTSPYRATTGTRLPYNFIKSVEIKAGGYEAQYGRTLGGIVNAVTHTGGNDFEANVFGFFTNNALATESRVGGTALTSGSFATYDVGFRVSGPFARDRLWFSAAYNPSFERVEKEITGHGFFEDRRTEHRFAGKLSWRAAQSTEVQLSFFGDPTTHHAVGGVAYTVQPTAQVVNPDPLLAFRQEGGVNLALLARHGLGDWGLIEGSVGRSSGSVVNRGDTDRGRSEPVFFDFVDGLLEGGYWTTSETQTRRTAATLKGTFFLGHHTVIAGAEYEDNFLDTGVFGGNIQRRDTSRYTRTLSSPAGTVHNRIPTLYVQDSWHKRSSAPMGASISRSLAISPLFSTSPIHILSSSTVPTRDSGVPPMACWTCRRGSPTLRNKMASRWITSMSSPSGTSAFSRTI